MFLLHTLFTQAHQLVLPHRRESLERGNQTLLRCFLTTHRLHQARQQLQTLGLAERVIVPRPANMLCKQILQQGGGFQKKIVEHQRPLRLPIQRPFAQSQRPSSLDHLLRYPHRSRRNIRGFPPLSQLLNRPGELTPLPFLTPRARLLTPRQVPNRQVSHFRGTALNHLPNQPLGDVHWFPPRLLNCSQQHFGLLAPVCPMLLAIPSLRALRTFSQLIGLRALRADL
mmetsp:Transcript_73229/g.152891  ORF Transcript_73229/g.152891 Transcript_73229/m.152891 type:complete len:227 (-) Transcript_73229:309-989(-)